MAACPSKRKSEKRAPEGKEEAADAAFHRPALSPFPNLIIFPLRPFLFIISDFLSFLPSIPSKFFNGRLNECEGRWEQFYIMAEYGTEEEVVNRLSPSSKFRQMRRVMQHMEGPIRSARAPFGTSTSLIVCFHSLTHVLLSIFLLTGKNMSRVIARSGAQVSPAPCPSFIYIYILFSIFAHSFFFVRCSFSFLDGYFRSARG